MASTSEAIIEKLREAKVVPEDIQRWTRFLPQIAPAALENILKFITVVPDGLRFANNDLKAKDQALDTLDERRWQQIQDWEKNYLKSIKTDLPI